MDFDISRMVYSSWTAMQWLAYWITFTLNWTKLKHTQCSHIRNNIFKKKYLKSILSNTQYKLKKTRRCVSVYLSAVVLWVRYFEHALLQLKNCHHILPERTNPLLHLFAEPHSLYSMSQSTTKIVSFHDNVWKYAHLQCRHAWSQIATRT